MIARHAAVPLALAALLSAVAARAVEAPAYVDVARAVAAHPLHAMLAQYDREIAALRATLTVPTSGAPAVQARAGAATVVRAATRRSRTWAPSPHGPARATGRWTRRDRIRRIVATRGRPRDGGVLRRAGTRETSASLAGVRPLHRRTQRARPGGAAAAASRA